jgi:hypothetical protein
VVSKTTGVVLATGGIALANKTVFHGEPMDWRIPVATGLAAVGFSLAERAWPQGAEILAWTALLTILLTRTSPNVPSVAESAVKWFNNTGGTSK